MPTLTVIINGSDENRWKKWGLKQNPFPQIPKAEYNNLCMMINRLDGEPFPTVEALEEHLRKAQASDEFVELCCSKYRKGERVKFDITFPD